MLWRPVWPQSPCIVTAILRLLFLHVLFVHISSPNPLTGINWKQEQSFTHFCVTSIWNIQSINVCWTEPSCVLNVNPISFIQYCSIFLSLINSWNLFSSFWIIKKKFNVMFFKFIIFQKGNEPKGKIVITLTVMSLIQEIIAWACFRKQNISSPVTKFQILT